MPGMSVISNHLRQSLVPQTFRERLKDISMFFDATDRIHQTMRRVALKLEETGIHYALAGGMPVTSVLKKSGMRTNSKRVKTARLRRLLSRI
jgi:hypothetical protein